MNYQIQNSPWGAVHNQREVIEGVTFVSTASHGGFVLNQEREHERVRLFPAFTPFAGAGFYEEDQDWSIVVLTFPASFQEIEVLRAVDTVRISSTMRRSEQWLEVLNFIDNDPSQHAQDIRAIYARMNLSATCAYCGNTFNPLDLHDDKTAADALGQPWCSTCQELEERQVRYHRAAQGAKKEAGTPSLAVAAV